MGGAWKTLPKSLVSSLPAGRLMHRYDKFVLVLTIIMASEMSAGSYVPLSKGIYLNRPNATPGALEVNTTSHPT